MADADAAKAPTDVSEADDTDGKAKEEAGADGQTAVIDMTVTETVVEVVTPTSDTILASLQLAVSAQTGGPVPSQTGSGTGTLETGDATAATGPVTAEGSKEATNPAAQLATPLAQFQRSAAQATGQGAGPAADGQATEVKAADGKVATDAAVPTDGLVPAAPTAAGQTAETLPTDDDTALPVSFADMIAAAKAKLGEKGGAKQPGTESGGRNDSQPQPQTPLAVAQPAAASVPAAELLKSAAADQAIGALDTAAPTADTGSATPVAGSHTHAALAAMEAPHAPAQADATQAAATVLRPSRGTAGMPLGVPDQVAVHIKKNVASDVDQFTINLHPAELGRIDIKLDIGADGRVSAMVAVEKAQTLELLQKDSRGLERALQDAGLQADSNSLNFSLRGEGNPFQGDNRGGGSGKRGRGFAGNGEEVDPTDGAAYTVTVGNGRLDIHA